LFCQGCFFFFLSNFTRKSFGLSLFLIRPFCCRNTEKNLSPSPPPWPASFSPCRYHQRTFFFSLFFFISADYRIVWSFWAARDGWDPPSPRNGMISSSTFFSPSCRQGLFFILHLPASASGVFFLDHGPALSTAQKRMSLLLQAGRPPLTFPLSGHPGMNSLFFLAHDFPLSFRGCFLPPFFPLGHLSSFVYSLQTYTGVVYTSSNDLLTLLSAFLLLNRSRFFSLFFPHHSISLFF